MKIRYFVAAAIILVAIPMLAQAVDLTKIDRRIGKEPVYENKPKYCLLVFGPEAKTRVWLVADGDSVYLDKNANGDLTEVGERIALGEMREINHANHPLKGERETPVVEISLPSGGTKCRINVLEHFFRKDFVARNELDRKMRGDLEQSPDHSQLIVLAYLDGKPRQQAWPIFADRPKASPILHLDGPLTLEAYGLVRPALVQGRTPIDLQISLATLGLGQNAVAFRDYNDVPESIRPTIKVEFPAAGRDATPLVRTFTFQRC